MRAIIIGSGIAGLSTALALRRVGMDVSVYERAPELTEVGAGISLWANALRALDHIGVGDRIRAASQPMRRSEFRIGDGFVTLVSQDAADIEKRYGGSPFVAMIHRADLVGTLASLLPDGVARYGFECIGVESDERKAAVRFANGHVDEADVVIGADGIRSVVRSSLFGLEQPRFAGYLCWRGICPRPASLKAGYVGEWWGRGRRFGITSLPADRVYWWATKNSPQNAVVGDMKGRLAEAFRSWCDPVPELIATTPEDHVICNDILDRPPTRNWVRGCAVLIGDAAHPTTPNFGQGGCMAIEDAAVLARCLKKGASLSQSLAAFVAERHPRTTSITNGSRRFGWIGQWEGRYSCWLRDRLFGVAVPILGSGSLLQNATFDVGPLPTLAEAG